MVLSSMETVSSSLKKLSQDNNFALVNLGPDLSLQDLGPDPKAAQDLGADLGQDLPTKIKLVWLKLQLQMELGAVIFAVTKMNTFATVASLAMRQDL